MSGESLRGYSGDMGAGKPPDLGWCSRCPKIGGLMANLSLAEVGALGISPEGIDEVTGALTERLAKSIAAHPSAQKLDDENLAKTIESIVRKKTDQVETDNIASTERSRVTVEERRRQIEELTKGCAGPTASGAPDGGGLIEWSCNSDNKDL